MKDLKPTKGSFYISRLIEEGEHECQDFKFSVSDASKIAHSISAFANHKGGRLLIGVKDNGVVAGVKNEEDIYVVELAASSYCRPPQNVSFKMYNVEGGLKVVSAEVAPASERPVMARENDGRWKVYCRVADENLVAHPLMVEYWRRKYHGGGQLVLSDEHRRFVKALADAGIDRFDEAEAARVGRTSESTARRLLVDLALSELITFVRDTDRFKMKLV